MNPQEFIAHHVSMVVTGQGCPDAIAKDAAAMCVNHYNERGFDTGGVMPRMMALARAYAKDETGMTGFQATIYSQLVAVGVIYRDQILGTETRALNQLVKKDKAAYDQAEKLWRLI